MKFAENSILEALTIFLTERDMGISTLNGKIESFSLNGKPSNPSSPMSSSSPVVVDINVNNKRVRSMSLTTKSDNSNTSGVIISSYMEEFKSKCGSIPEHEPFSQSLHLSSLAIPSMNNILQQPQLSLPQRSDVFIPVSDHFPSEIMLRRRSGSLDFGQRKTNRRRASSLGDLSKPSARRLLVDMISTLNEFFPDYDFETTKPEQFVVQELNNVIRTVNSHFAELTETDTHFIDRLWQGIDDSIDLNRCEIFSYVPDMTEDPFSDCSLWSFNYFFFNGDLKRITYFTCVATSKYSYANRMLLDQSYESDDDMDDENEEEDDENDESGLMMEEESDEDNNHPAWEGII